MFDPRIEPISLDLRKLVSHGVIESRIEACHALNEFVATRYPDIRYERVLHAASIYEVTAAVDRLPDDLKAPLELLLKLNLEAQKWPNADDRRLKAMKLQKTPMSVQRYRRINSPEHGLLRKLAAEIVTPYQATNEQPTSPLVLRDTQPIAAERRSPYAKRISPPHR